MRGRSLCVCVCVCVCRDVATSPRTSLSVTDGSSDVLNSSATACADTVAVAASAAVSAGASAGRSAANRSPYASASNSVRSSSITAEIEWNETRDPGARRIVGQRNVAEISRCRQNADGEWKTEMQGAAESGRRGKEKAHRWESRRRGLKGRRWRAPPHEISAGDARAIQDRGMRRLREIRDRSSSKCASCDSGPVGAPTAGPQLSAIASKSPPNRP